MYTNKLITFRIFQNGRQKWVSFFLNHPVHVISNNAWVFSNGYCIVYPAMCFLTIGGNVMSLSGTAFSRYLKIVHPKAFNFLFGRRLNISITVCSFLSVPVLLISPPVIGVWGEIGYEPKVLACTILRDNSGYRTFTSTSLIAIAITFISFCYLCILRKVCSNRRTIQAARNDADGNQPAAASREDIRYTRMMVSIFVVFLLSYMPYVINTMMDPNIQDLTNVFISTMFFWFGSCINPVLYGLLNRKFRQAFVKIFKQVKHQTSISRSDDKTNQQQAHQ